MRKLWTWLAVLACWPQIVWAQASGVDNQLEQQIKPIADKVSNFVFYSLPFGEYQVPWILFWLILVGLFCTFYFGFINVRGLAQGFRIIRGDYADPAHSGDTSHFQALATALSGTVGLGNIAGVAAAIALGGPGAAFWMVVAAFLGMAAKFCECTLAVKYRSELPDGSVSGGPMYYLRMGITANYPQLAVLGKILGVSFAIFCLFGTIGSGNFFQVNQAFQAVKLATGGDASWLADKAWLFGVVMAILVGVVVIGGIKRIAKVTDKLVPLMAVLYVSACLVVIIANISHLPSAIGTIVSGAFTGEGVAGGMLGALLVGFRRAAFSNEAGIGSAPIAHSTVKTGEPLTEGLVALWEPMIDTVFICSMTAITIVITGVYADSAAQGVVLTSSAFATVMPWFPNVLAFVVLMFAYSTMVAYCYYGVKAANYLFGESKAVDIGYKLFYLTATVFGVVLSFDQLVDFADAIYFLMAVPNVVGMYLLAPVVKREMKSYFDRLARGEIKSSREAPEHLIGSP
ncbi:MAG: alanine:cation symporter family protein [Xanthomonadales bacterium]|nr:alanine:cation symporter family protein [Xanthomonadales bacterium]